MEPVIEAGSDRIKAKNIVNTVKLTMVSLV